MKKLAINIIDNNWFFVAVLSFVLVLPFSQALVSIFSGLMLLVAIVEDRKDNKIFRFKKNSRLLAVPFIYLIYILSAVVSKNFSASLYDLQKSMFFFVIPLAFIIGKGISAKQVRFIFFSFSVAIVVSTFVAFLNWKVSTSEDAFAVHRASLISHIRFSFQLILAFWFNALFVGSNYKKLTKTQIAFLLLGAFYFIGFLFFQQSLTGIIAFTGSIVVFMVSLLFRMQRKVRIYFLLLFILLALVPVVYIAYSVSRFYDIEKVNKDTIDKQTAHGHLYQHHFENLMVENGHYVYLYVCEDEMREEWNKISSVKYDSVGMNGYVINSTLMRYLTSKGLRKDAEGVKALTKEDIHNIENGIANVIYTGHEFSLYPRIYQTIWEYYTYSKNGNANQKSFSQRIEYAKAALSIIKENPWFGVGTGNWKEAFKEAYEKNNPQFRQEYYASSHNQYLNYMVKFGIVGFIAIFLLLLYPVIKRDKFKDIFFLLFLSFMFFANFGDSNFESHMGSSFFVFFYSLMVLGGNSYLLIDSTREDSIT